MKKIGLYLKKDLKVIVFSLLLTVALYFQNLITNNNKKLGFLKDINILKSLLIFVIIFIIVFIIIKLLIKFSNCLEKESKEYSNKSIKKIFFISLISMLLIWSICLITFFPGGGMWDTFTQIESPIYATSGHPIGHNFLLYTFIVIIGQKILNSSIIGWALFSIFQMIVMAGSISFAICFLSKRRVSKVWIVILTLIYSILPIYASYSIFAIKDVMFSILILYLFLLLIKLVESDGKLLTNKKFIILYIAISLALYLTRSNAFVVYILTTLVILIRYNKEYKKVFILIFLIPILFNFLICKVFEVKYGVEHRFQENVAIPIQQLSATVYEDGILNKQEKEYINSLMPLDEIKDKYNSGVVDSIKWDSNFNRDYLQVTKSKFIKTWLTAMPKNFRTYVESYMLQTYYYWNINPISNNTNMFYDDVITDKQGEFIEKVKSKYNIRYDNILPNNIQNSLEDFYYKYTNFLNEGTCFWIFMLLMLILIIKKQSKFLIPNVTLFAVWLSLMASAPINSSLRYMYPFVLILPILFVYVVAVKKD